MRLSYLTFLTWTLCCHAFSSTPRRYAQIVLPFDQERPFDFHYNQTDNSLVLEIQKTTAEELPALKNYDETLIRRLILKELTGSATEVRIILKDHNVRATVTSFQEPYRIVIDLFQKGFRDERDAKTGFPFASNNTRPSQTNRRPYIPKTFIENQNRPTINAPRLKLSDSTGGDGTLNHDEDSPHLQGKRKLLQPTPKGTHDPEALSLSLKKIPKGRGGSWKKYPTYIYRIQLASFKSGKSYKDFLNKNAQRAVSSMKSMADYAGKLFDFGHEGRALAAYRHVIHKSPILFDKHPLHLWRLAEIHMGQGNLTLADGYYQAMVDKHPDHPLSRFAKMRRLDVKSLRLTHRSEPNGFNDLVPPLEEIDPGKDPELRGQIAIRKVYWSQNPNMLKSIIENKYLIPKLTTDTKHQLETSYNNIENPWTGFITATLILNKRLSNETPWSKDTSKLASHYFKTYRGNNLEPFRGNLWEKMVKKINSNITTMVEKQDYLKAIDIYDSLGPDLKKIKRTTQTSWSLGEAYRLLGQPELAVPFYKNASKRLQNGENRFRSIFWHLVTLNDTIDTKTGANSNTASLERLKNERRQANNKLLQSWRELKPEERRDLLVSMKSPLESILKSSALLSGPTDILLEAWKNSLLTKKGDSTSKIEGLKSSYAATGDAVDTIVAIANKFKMLGNKGKVNQARFLLSKLDPKSFDKDKDTEDLWAKNLVALAETYRESNQYLDAGRIYALTGEKSENYEGRAEALYKGGLLLYRAGRREEALQAFTQASQDGNNLLYSELAKKRLDQLNQ